jgi:hypothetical protein
MSNSSWFWILTYKFLRMLGKFLPISPTSLADRVLSVLRTNSMFLFSREDTFWKRTSLLKAKSSEVADEEGRSHLVPTR